MSPWVTAPSALTSSPLPAFLSGFTFTVKSPLCTVASLVLLSTTASLGRGVLVPGTVFVAAGAGGAPADDGVPCWPIWLPRLIGGRFARMMGSDFDVSCDCSAPFEDGEAPVEVFALLSAALNSPAFFLIGGTPP